MASWMLGAAPFLLLACGGESKTRALDPAPDAGRGSPDGSGPTPDASSCDPRFRLQGTLRGQRFEYCSTGELGAFNNPFDGGWRREAIFGPDMSGALWMTGPDKPADGVPMTGARALVRLPNSAPVGADWLCGDKSSLTPYLLETTEKTPEPFDFGALSELGLCQGDAASTDWARFEITRGQPGSMTGSIQGTSVPDASLGVLCFADHPVCTLTLGPNDTGGKVITIASAMDQTGAAIELAEGAWLAPGGISADLLCAGPGSTISIEASRLVIELRGIRALSCPGKPEPGRISGTL